MVITKVLQMHSPRFIIFDLMHTDIISIYKKQRLGRSYISHLKKQSSSCLDGKLNYNEQKSIFTEV